jgi:hypothetical protein
LNANTTTPPPQVAMLVDFQQSLSTIGKLSLWWLAKVSLWWLAKVSSQCKSLCVKVEMQQAWGGCLTCDGDVITTFCWMYFGTPCCCHGVGTVRKVSNLHWYKSSGNIQAGLQKGIQHHERKCIS